jgi:hypothetical protein
MERFFIFFIISILLSSCYNSQRQCIDCTQTPLKESIHIIQLIDTISATYSTENTIEISCTVYERKEFMTLIKYACQYKTELLNIVVNNHLNIKKEIALYALEHICIEDYITVIEELYKNYLTKNISPELFDKSITTTLSHEVSKNYDNPRLQELFNQILLDSSFTEGDKNYIRNLKSGKVWDGISWDYYFNDRKVPWLE